jgi:hypothetical protein
VVDVHSGAAVWPRRVLHSTWGLAHVWKAAAQAEGLMLEACFPLGRSCCWPWFKRARARQNLTCAMCFCLVLLQVAACPADAAQGLLSSGGTALLTSALQASAADTGPSTAQLQHQLLSAVNAVLSADQGPSRPPGDLTQLTGAMHALLESPDACVAAAAKAAIERVSSFTCLTC